MCHGRECVLFHFLECEISPRGIIKGDPAAAILDLNNRKKSCSSSQFKCHFLVVGGIERKGRFFLVTLFVTSKLSG